MGYQIVQPRSSGTSAQRPVSAPVGFEYFETDTNRRLLWTGSNWIKTNGQWEPQFGTTTFYNSSSSGVAATGVPVVIGSYSMSTPTGLGGPVKVQGSCSWTSSGNSAAFYEITIDGTVAASVRLHNHSSGYGVFRSANVQGQAFLTPGTHTVAVRATVDSGATAMVIYDAYGYLIF